MRKLNVTFEFPTGDSNYWTTKNPILNKDEPGFDLDEHNFKFGDGFTRWNDLEWFLSPSESGGDDGTAMAALQAHINSLTPHPVYDDGPSLTLLYENAKV